MRTDLGRKASPDVRAATPSGWRARGRRLTRQNPLPMVISLPAHAAIAPGHDGRKSAAKQKLGKKGKPDSEEPSKSDAAKDEPAKGEAAKEDAPKSDTAKEEATKPSGESKSQVSQG